MRPCISKKSVFFLSFLKVSGSKLCDIILILNSLKMFVGRADFIMSVLDLNNSMPWKYAWHIAIQCKWRLRVGDQSRKLPQM
jgi:hypothetical protein